MTYMPVVNIFCLTDIDNLNKINCIILDIIIAAIY